MSFLYSCRQKTPDLDFVYEITEAPANLALDLNQLKDHLKIVCHDDSQDQYLTLLVKTVTNYAQNYTRRTFLNTKFITYRDCFCCDCIELRRAKLQSIENIKYLKSDILITVDSNIYYFIKSNDFSSVVLKDGESWPIDADDILQAVQINFTAGYGTSSDDIPDDLQLALLNHVTAIYENRGDCDEASIISLLPNTSKMIYDFYKILSITLDMKNC